jgi:cytochrome oxidase assembly protein ShyY1
VTRLRFDLEWRLTAFTVLLFPALLSLGFWQLSRGEEKAAIAAAQEARAAQPPVPLAQLLRGAQRVELAYTPVRLRGEFHPAAMLLKDNQLRDGRYGVDVVALFRDADAGRWVLLNRGWVPADPARRSLPEIATPTAMQRLVASVYIPPGEPYTLAPEALPEAWPLLVQNPVDPQLRRALEQRLGGDLYPFELRLAADQPAGFRRDWPVVNVSPAKHRGYAVQWFTMAAALLILFVLRSSNLYAVLRGRSEEPEETPEK